MTVLGPNGAPTPPFATRLVPPASRMGPLTDVEIRQALAASAQVRRYAQAVDRPSAEEKLAGERPDAADAGGSATPAQAARGGARAPGTLEMVLRSPVTRTVAREFARGLMGALLGGPRRRR